MAAGKSFHCIQSFAPMTEVTNPPVKNEKHLFVLNRHNGYTKSPSLSDFLLCQS